MSQTIAAEIHHITS